MEKINFDGELKNLIEEEIEKCIGCNKCMKGCPMLDEFTENAKDLLIELNEDQYYTTNMPYSCMLCGYCEKVCPTDVSFKNIFFKMRRLYIENNGGNINSEVNASSTNFHQSFSFSPLFSSPIGNLSSDIVFFPGCALQADSPELTSMVYDYLKEIFPGIGYWNICCAKPTNFLGREDKFLERMEKIKEEYRKKGIKRIVTACMNCTMTLDDYCEDLEVISVYNVLAENLPEGLEAKFADLDQRVNIQDPCPSRYYPDIQENVRGIIQRLGFEIEDLRFSKNQTICCSAGGIVQSTQPEIAEKHKERRVNDGDYPMITFCKECERQLGHARQIDHILDLIFYDKDKLFQRHDGSTVKDWTNRFKAKSIK